jgi:hypothetical protein
LWGILTPGLADSFGNRFGRELVQDAISSDVRVI